MKSSILAHISAHISAHILGRSLAIALLTSLTLLLQTLPVAAAHADAGMIAYVRFNNESGDEIWLINPDGSGYRRITNAPACDDLAAYPKGSVRVEVQNWTGSAQMFYVYKMRRLVQNGHLPAWSLRQPPMPNGAPSLTNALYLPLAVKPALH